MEQSSSIALHQQNFEDAQIVDPTEHPSGGDDDAAIQDSEGGFSEDEDDDFYDVTSRELSRSIIELERSWVDQRLRLERLETDKLLRDLNLFQERYERAKVKLDAAYHSSLKKEAEAKSRTTAAGATATSCGTSLVDTSYWSSSSSSSEAESPSPLKCFVDVKAEEGDEEEKEGDGGARRKLHFSSATFEADERDLAMEDIGGDAGGDSSAPSDQGNADGGEKGDVQDEQEVSNAQPLDLSFKRARYEDEHF